MQPPPPDWQLPPGVSHGLWDYLHDPAVARQYDESLTGTPLLEADLRFADRHFVQPGRLIDLGCGTGRLLLPCAQRGFWVLGVDLSAEMLRVCGEKASAAGVQVERLQANLVQLDCLADANFDYSACLFSTLGMVTGRVQRQRVVSHAFRLLRPGGVLVLHVHNRWFNCWDTAGRWWLLKDLLRSCLGKDDAGDRVMPAHRGLARLTLHHFTRREVRRLLQSVGFEIVEMQPVGLRPDGRLALPRWFGWLRAYGYLIAARRPD